MRHTRSFAFGTAAVIAAAGGWLVLSPGTAEAGGRLTFFIHDTKQATVAQQPGAAKQGDLFAYHGLIYDTKGGKKIGRFGGACVQLDAAGTPSDSSCSVDYVLPGGQLHTEIFGANDFLYSGKPFPFSVLGGTGKYSNARGEGTMRIPPDAKVQTNGFVTIRLTG